MSKLLGREDLMKKATLKKEKVELSRGHVFVREMTGKEKDVWEKSITKQKPSGNKNVPFEYEIDLEGFRAKLTVVTVCDEQGNLLFDSKDVAVLNEMMSAADMDKIVTVAQRLNAITEKDREEILKN